MCRRFGTECSETPAHKIRTPRNHPKEIIQHSEHGESLKRRIFFSLNKGHKTFYSRRLFIEVYLRTVSIRTCHFISGRTVKRNLLVCYFLYTATAVKTSCRLCPYVTKIVRFYPCILEMGLQSSIVFAALVAPTTNDIYAGHHESRNHRINSKNKISLSTS